MEIQLVSKEKAYLKEFSFGKTLRETFQFDSCEIHELCDHLFRRKEGEEIQQIKALALSHKTYSLALQLPSDKRSLMTVSITSSFFRELQCMLHQGNLEKNLKLSFSAKIDNNGSMINSKDLKPRSGINGKDGHYPSHIEYVDHDVPYLIGMFERNEIPNPIGASLYPLGALGTLPIPESRYLEISLSVEIEENDFLPLKGLLPDMLSLNHSFYEDKESCDVTIETMEGSNVQCHKVILTSSSPVFRGMFKNDCLESKTNRLEMKDMSTDGVTALLEFLYFRGMAKAKGDSKLALELLTAADKYDVKPLKQALLTLILTRFNTWFHVKSALELYLLIRNMDGVDTLKEKILEVQNLRKECLTRSVLRNDERFTKDVCLELLSVALQRKRKVEEIEVIDPFPLSENGDDDEDGTENDSFDNSFIEW